MTKLASGVLVMGVMLIGFQAFAADMHKDHKTQVQIKKTCMAKMAAKNDGSTKKQMKAACLAEMKNSMGPDDTMSPPKNP